MLQALAPSPKTEKSAMTGRVGFDNLAHEEVFERLHALIPVQPGDMFRAWGVNSFTALRMSGVSSTQELPSSLGIACRPRHVERRVPTPGCGLQVWIPRPRSWPQGVHRSEKSKMRSAERQK